MPAQPMSEPTPLLIERVQAPDWIGTDAGLYEPGLWAALGEQVEWGFAIPWVSRAVASPAGRMPMLQPPRRGDDFMKGALAYWCSLLHLLIYSFGWARPDRGLRWWYDAGKPTDDLRLQLLSAVWDADGQLDWFAAWLWASSRMLPTELFTKTCGYVEDEVSLKVDKDWVDRQSREAEASGIPAPIGGGGDPLHLAAHISGPLEDPTGQSLLARTDDPEQRAVLLLDSMVGWYKALAVRGATLPELQQRSWYLNVIVKPVGWLGTFRCSRVTGLWFSGKHSLHLRGV